MGKLDVGRLAARLIRTVARIDDVLTPHDMELAQAEFSGMCKAVNAIGFGHSEHHIEMLVRQAYREQPVPDPSKGLAATNKWEREITKQLATELNAVL